MRILLACDKFKGTLTSTQVSEHLMSPLLESGHVVTALPLADGGDGSVDAAVQCGFTHHTSTVEGPLGDGVEAAWASRVLDDGTVCGLVELAQASGIALVHPDSRTAKEATTFGTGQLIREALDFGCTEVVLAVGGSATTDGGLGMLRALGASHSPWQPGQPVTVDLSGLDSRIPETRFVLASDVENPLTGPNGAAHVFGPQKGANDADIALLDTTLESLADQLDPDGRFRSVPGAGAAGGAGFAALAAFGAEQWSGADFIMELTGFRRELGTTELVITGEGRFDSQTLQGKGPGAVLREAERLGIPAHVVCGSSEFQPGGLDALPIAVTRQWALTDYAEPEVCMRTPGPVLDRVAQDLAALLTRQVG